MIRAEIAGQPRTFNGRDVSVSGARQTTFPASTGTVANRLKQEIPSNTNVVGDGHRLGRSTTAADSRGAVPSGWGFGNAATTEHTPSAEAQADLQ